MSVTRGIVVGALSLTALEVLVTNDTAASRVGGLATGLAGLTRAFISPDVPAIRDRSGCLDAPAHTAGSSTSSAHGQSLLRKVGGPLAPPLFDAEKKLIHWLPF